jgi:hypothetical protein
MTTMIMRMTRRGGGVAEMTEMAERTAPSHPLHDVTGVGMEGGR